MKTFKIYADAAELRVQVFPTMQALGDQPWGVHLYDLGDGLLLNEEAIFAEAGSAYDAAVKVSSHPDGIAIKINPKAPRS